MMAQRQDDVWQAQALTTAYLEGVRGAIPLAAEQIDIIVRLARAARPDTRLILDLGCGDGILGHALLDAFTHNQPKGIFADFSKPMLDAARSRLVGYEATFLEIDYARPDWVSKVSQLGDLGGIRPDVVVSGFSIHHQSDERKHAVYREIFDLLSPGGIFLNLEHVASASRWGEEQFEEYFIDSLHHYHAPFGKTRTEVAADFYHRPDKIANILAPVEVQCEWLREIGYGKVDCFLKVFELALFGGIKPEEANH
ncbi:MAG: class I SAM-dependent methyltransferase [Anaerolineae bacterium]|nr:class I SAM-dependent methyltransferase [Anaerolineae bacterium]